MQPIEKFSALSIMTEQMHALGGVLTLLAPFLLYSLSKSQHEGF